LVEQSRDQEKVATEAMVSRARDSFFGKRFWVVPNPKATKRLRFLEEDVIKTAYPNIDSAVYQIRYGGFVLTEPASFVVSGFANDYYGIGDGFAKVMFDDGKVAFLETRRWILPEDFKHLFKNEYSGTEQHSSYEDTYEEYVLTASPSDIAATVSKRNSDIAEAEGKTKKKAAAAAAAWKARGGVRIGMTQKQVLASNWGRPDSINKTTGSYGTHEQWVYGGRNYLYFENGILTTIQN
jgi:hypothetical protein